MCKVDSASEKWRSVSSSFIYVLVSWLLVPDRDVPNVGVRASAHKLKFLQHSWVVELQHAWVVELSTLNLDTILNRKYH